MAATKSRQGAAAQAPSERNVRSKQKQKKLSLEQSEKEQINTGRKGSAPPAKQQTVKEERIWTAPPAPQPQNILEEANATVGPANRGADYGQPLDNFEMEAELMNVWLAHRNYREAPPLSMNWAILTAHDMAIHKLFMKITREANRHKRDNSVDIAGYAWCLEEMIEEEKRRYGR